MADLMIAADTANLAPLCQLLSRLFVAQPDEALLQSCRQGDDARLLTACQAEPALALATRHLFDAVAAADVAMLGRAWTLLFSGAGGPATVAPYASVFQDGRLYGAATARMHDLLSGLDMSVAADCLEAPDHIAIQLTLLAVLIGQKDFAAADRFRQTELAWVEGFCRLCVIGDPTGFYAGAAELAAAVTQLKNQGQNAP
jgi:TorA-specific chaperone